MPNYRFSLRSRYDVIATSSAEFPNIIAAQNDAARRFAAALITHQTILWRDEELTLDMADEAGLILLSMVVGAFFSPGSGHKSPAND